MTQEQDSVTPRAALIAVIIARVKQRHPMQYGFLGKLMIMHTENVVDERMPPSERFNRCPECEQWSPCDVRMVADELEKEIAFADDAMWVLASMVVGWEEMIGVDLAQHPEVLRISATYKGRRGTVGE